MKKIMIREIPDGLHKKLKMLAAEQEITMNEMLLEMLKTFTRK